MIRHYRYKRDALAAMQPGELLRHDRGGYFLVSAALPPTPAPAAVSPPFPLPFAFTQGDHENLGRIETVIQRCQDAYVRTLLLQFACSWTREDVQALRAAGIQSLLWGIAPSDAEVERACAEIGVTSWVAQVEDRVQLTLLLDVPRRQLFGKPCAVVATSGGVPDEKTAQRLVAAGINWVFAEAYADSGWPFYELDRMVFQFQHLASWDCLPVIGLFHGFSPHDHVGIEKWWPRVGIWELGSLNLPFDTLELRELQEAAR